MNDFIIAIGHTASGNIGCGAVDNLDESNCTRQIGPLVANYLVKGGSSVGAVLRIDKSNAWNCEDCYTRANQANEIGANWYVEVHLNSGKEHTGDGSEVCICSNNTEVQEMADRVSTSISGALSIDNRGVKRENLIVLKRTNMKAILVECMFVDCNDPSKYNPDVIAKAIAEGLLGHTINIKPLLGWNKSANSRWWYCTDVEKYTYYNSSWQLIDGFWYLFDSDGWCITGWKQYITQKDKIEHWYYLDSNSCKMAVGWKQIDGGWYYFNNDGEMQTGWIKDDKENDYYLYSTGEMAANIDYIGYSFDKDGHPTKL